MSGSWESPQGEEVLPLVLSRDIVEAEKKMREEREEGKKEDRAMLQGKAGALVSSEKRKTFKQ